MLYSSSSNIYRVFGGAWSYWLINLLFDIFLLNIQKSKKIIQSKNYIQIGAFIYLVINFVPIIPGGSFFSDFNITFFMLNLSLMYAVDAKTNIFGN